MDVIFETTVVVISTFHSTDHVLIKTRLASLALAYVLTLSVLEWPCVRDRLYKNFTDILATVRTELRQSYYLYVLEFLV